MFLELKSVEVAEQMTLIDFNMFKSIRVLIGHFIYSESGRLLTDARQPQQPQELLSGAWNKEPLKYRAHHVINLISTSKLPNVCALSVRDAVSALPDCIFMIWPYRPGQLRVAVGGGHDPAAA